jgi:hypothetical protein
MSERNTVWLRPPWGEGEPKKSRQRLPFSSLFIPHP